MVPAVVQWLGGSRFTTMVAAVLQRAHGTLLSANLDSHLVFKKKGGVV